MTIFTSIILCIYCLFQTQRERSITLENIFGQVPEIDSPTSMEFNNWNMHPLIKLSTHVAKEEWTLYLSFSVDEVTMRLKKKNKNISPTRWEVMVSKTMISVNKDTHNKFKWKILLHPRSNFSGGSIHWIVVFLVSLIGYNMIITNFQRTTFINLIISTLNHTILRIMCYVMMLK